MTPGILLHLLKLGKKRRAEPSAVIAQEGSLLGAPVHEMSGTLASLLQAFWGPPHRRLGHPKAQWAQCLPIMYTCYSPAYIHMPLKLTHSWCKKFLWWNFCIFHKNWSDCTLYYSVLCPQGEGDMAAWWMKGTLGLDVRQTPLTPQILAMWPHARILCTVLSSVYL